MSIYDHSVRSYQDAVDYLGDKQNRPLGNNTRLDRRDDGAIRVLYHGSPVVTYIPPGVCDPQPVTLLDSCGWRTLTTKERINAFCPDGFQVNQERSTWYLNYRPAVRDPQNRRYTFADGITILANGTVVNDGPSNEAEQVKKLVARIRKYAKAYTQALLDGKLPAPSSGDCWYCAGMLSSDPSHLSQHLEENYLVPSLLKNAVDSKPLPPILMGSIGTLWGYNGEDRKITDWERSLLQRDLPRSIVHYFKHELNIAC